MRDQSLRVAVEQLRLLREDRGWSSADLAERSCQPQELVEQAEQGQPVEPQVVAALAEALEVPIAQLRRDTMEPLLNHLKTLTATAVKPENKPAHSDSTAFRRSLQRGQLISEKRYDEGCVPIKAIRVRPSRAVRYFSSWKTAFIRFFTPRSC